MEDLGSVIGPYLGWACFRVQVMRSPRKTVIIASEISEYTMTFEERSSASASSSSSPDPVPSGKEGHFFPVPGPQGESLPKWTWNVPETGQPVRFWKQIESLRQGVVQSQSPDTKIKNIC